ncbi:MAG: trypsin-like peptidase domain-containing protein [Candidatus Hydrogenedentes bacterium]|nr:trypsin-like peptidase domain-containing protein [Candidatus Hydrogenedentota bacterium]
MSLPICCHSRFMGALLIFVALIPALAAPEQLKTPGVDAQGRTLLPDTPWTASGEKVVYGADDRIDVYAETDALREALAASVCALMNSSRVTGNGNGAFHIGTSAYLQGGAVACSGEPFGSQPVAAFCTGFLVGEDLIATAGHCYDDSDLASVRFVFGFEMIDGTTPRTTVNANEVYQGVEVVGRLLSFPFDYAVIRVDRAVNAPGAAPLEIRRDGVIAEGAPVGVIGHPAGLPKKIAFGPTTEVADNSPTGYFITNLDTYGGNSGSPVFDAATGLVEGILVRGATDYVFQDGCFVSNVLPDAAAGVTEGEDVSKSATFAHLVPELASPLGVLTLDREAYSCMDTLNISLKDSDLSGTAEAVVTSSGGDQETVTLDEVAAGRFSGSLGTSAGALVIENGVLSSAEGGSIMVSYLDADTGQGGPGVAEDTAATDCTAPMLSNVTVTLLTGTSAKVTLETDEPATAVLHFGDTCGAFTATSTASPLGMSHEIHLNDLAPLSTYYLEVEATDTAQNSASDGNLGACYSFTTLAPPDYYTEQFGADFDLDFTTLDFVPDGSGSAYALCISPASAFPVDPAGGAALGMPDDGSQQVVLNGGQQVSLYGTQYTSFFVGSNGYLTFGSPDTSYQDSPASHFSLPRISLLFNDLDPAAGGIISWKQLADRVAVTYAGVPEYGTANSNHFQVELFFGGRIRMSYLAVAAVGGIVGLSQGTGLPGGFQESNFSGYGACGGNDIESSLTPGFIEEGMQLVLTAPTGDNHQWKRNDVDLVEDAPRLTGVHARDLVFDPVLVDDAGVYAVAYDDGAKAAIESEAFVLAVLEPGSLPLGAATALALTGILFVIGWRRLRTP